jgi:hypothetical protein
MPRIRTIKPEFCTSEQTAMCSLQARLMFVLMWMFCDDGGRHQASVKRLKMEVFPADPVSDSEIQGWINELKAAIGDDGLPLLIEYEVNGVSYWEVTGWERHQKIDKPYFRHPSKDGSVQESWKNRRQFDERYRNVPGTFDERSPPESSRIGIGIGNGNVNIDRSIEGDCGRPIDKVDWGSFDWGSVAEPSNQTLQRLELRTKSNRDKRLVLVANALVLAGVMPEAWLSDSIAGYRETKATHRNHWAYFQKCLGSNADRRGVNLRTVMESIEVPEWLLNGARKTQERDL